MTFERSEYEDRLRRVRERMAEQGLGSLISTDPANMHYLTGCANGFRVGYIDVHQFTLAK